MTKLDMTAAAVAARLKEVSARADLRPEHRLDSKLDMSPKGVAARLRLVSDLRALCQRLARR